MNNKDRVSEVYKLAYPHLYELAIKNNYLIDNVYKTYILDKPNWYHLEFIDDNTSEFDDMHKNMLIWLYENIDDCEKHCRWIRTHRLFQIKFRYEKNYMWFKLRWL